ncbi:MAG: hypothetical protein OHK0023_13230 [Anaerolineae bacterium]
MQHTRRHILEILRERGECTVDELVEALQARIQHPITGVTVRHHIDVLRSEDMVSPPAVKRSGAPGRPQYVYSLTEKAREQFPNNYQNLLTAFLEQLKAKLDAPQVNVILEGVADQMVNQAQLPHPALNAIPLEVRLDHVVNYLNTHGYDAEWRFHEQGYLLYTRNCPYHHIAQSHAELCGLDMRLIAGLIGIVPRSLGRIADDNDACVYLLPFPHQQAAQIG